MTGHLALRTLCRIADAMLICTVGIIALMLAATWNTPSAVGAPTLFGRSLFVVASGSMSPSLRPGDALLADTRVASDAISVGDVIVFRSAADPGLHVTHRVLDAWTRSDGERVFVTGGDANTAPDTTPVNASQVVGRHVMRLPRLGSALTAIRGGSLPLLFVVASVAAHGALTMARSVGPAGVDHRRGEHHPPKGTLT